MREGAACRHAVQCQSLARAAPCCPSQASSNTCTKRPSAVAVQRRKQAVQRRPPCLPKGITKRHTNCARFKSPVDRGRMTDGETSDEDWCFVGGSASAPNTACTDTHTTSNGMLAQARALCNDARSAPAAANVSGRRTLRQPLLPAASRCPGHNGVRGDACRGVVEVLPL